MEYWIVYSLDTFEEVYRGSSSIGDSVNQQLPPGTGLIVVPYAVIADGPLNLDALRGAMYAFVDKTANDFCAQFITPGENQMLRYLKKEAEARAWLLDNTVSTKFLSSEAADKGITVEELVPVVIARADEWATVGGPVEGRRVAVKDRIAAADTFADIVRLGRVDWAALVASAA